MVRIFLNQSLQLTNGTSVIFVCIFTISPPVEGESVSAIEIAGAFIEKFGGDSIVEMKRNFEGYLAQVRKF